MTTQPTNPVPYKALPFPVLPQSERRYLRGQLLAIENSINSVVAVLADLKARIEALEGS